MIVPANTTSTAIEQTITSKPALVVMGLPLADTMTVSNIGGQPEDVSDTITEKVPAGTVMDCVVSPLLQT